AKGSLQQKKWLAQVELEQSISKGQGKWRNREMAKRRCRRFSAESHAEQLRQAESKARFLPSDRAVRACARGGKSPGKSKVPEWHWSRRRRSWAWQFVSSHRPQLALPATT